MRFAKSNSFLMSKLIMFVILSVVIFWSTPAQAGFDHLYFSVNGDTTLSTMTQGDEFYWASNCDVGAIINWEIWYDANSNGTIDPGIDPILTSENIIDGSLASDADGTANGWGIGQSLMLSGEPGDYIFRAKDIASDSVLTKILTMVAMTSPPNQFTGQIILPGVTSPNSLLANHTVFAESDTGNEGAILGVTDNNGNYSMNVGAAGTGVEFFINVNQIPGYVAPIAISAIASGVVGGNDFTYETAVDSVWGFVKDDLGALINFEGSVYAYERMTNNSGTNSYTEGGRFVIYFSTTNKGNWALSADDYVYSPTYLGSYDFEFSHDTLTSFQHDIVLYRADAAIYVEVTENGGLPANNYLVEASSDLLGAYNKAVSNTGSNNIVKIDISSQDNSGWRVSINEYDDSFPVPPGFILSSPIADVVPGDTVNLDLISGNLVSGTIHQDPEDSQINWNDVWIGAYDSFFRNFDVRAESNGVYNLYTDTGSFVINVYSDGYITDPSWISIDVTGDTSSSALDFTINETHCRVTGQLTNVSLPLDASYYSVYATTGGGGTNSYIAYGEVDSITGTYEMYLCDGTWAVNAPCCFPDTNAPTDTTIIIGEAPDTVRTLDLVYAIVLGVDDDVNGAIPDHFEMSQNYPNPFNPTTDISFALPGQSDVSIVIFNTLGQQVKSLVHESLPAGYHTVAWDGTNADGDAVASGVYLYKIVAGDFVSTKKMMLLK